jgi:hypothetical protein
MGVNLDRQNEWGVRWFTFFAALTAFIVFLVVLQREELVPGKITNEKGDTCLVAEGAYETFVVGRTSGEGCLGPNSFFAMRRDLRNTPILYQEPYGPKMCLTDDRRKPFLTLELCREDQPNQRWHLSNHHLISDAAIYVGDPKRCASVAMGLFFDPQMIAAKRLAMEDCRHTPRQLFGFRPFGQGIAE